MQARKASPLERGGTLSGELAAGKVCAVWRHLSSTTHGHRSTQAALRSQDAGGLARAAVTSAKESGPVMQIQDGRFVDARWEKGRWDLSLFAGKDGRTDWDAVRFFTAAINSQTQAAA